MTRILTPLGYEPKLSELNRFGSLGVKDNVIIQPTIPICDKQGTEKESGIQGELLKCDNQSSMLLKDTIADYETIEIISVYPTGPDWCEEMTPTITARVVMLKFYYTGETCDVYVITPNDVDMVRLIHLEYVPLFNPPPTVYLEGRGLEIQDIFIRGVFCG